MASTSSTKRRPRADWLALVREQRDSGLSAAAFCRERGLVYQTFVGRRRALDGELALCAEVPAADPTSPLPSFVEIGVAEPVLSPDTCGADWLVELDLGDGLQLRVRRSH